MHEQIKDKYLKPYDKDRPFPPAYAQERLTHPDNKDLSLYYDNTFKNYPIMTHRGPQVYAYLSRLVTTIEHYFNHHSKVLALRFELYFPHAWSLEQRLNKSSFTPQSDPSDPQSSHPSIQFKKDAFSRFLASFKAQLSAIEKQDKKRGVYRPPDLAFVRVFEQHDPVRDKRSKKRNRGLHIHVLCLLNGQRFQSLGLFDTNQKQAALSQNSLSTMIRKAWASALFGLTPNAEANPDLLPWQNAIPNYPALEAVHEQGLVYFSGAWKAPSSPKEQSQKRQDIVFAASYLTKATTKAFGLGVQPFVCGGESLTKNKIENNTKHNAKPYDADPQWFHRGNPQRPFYEQPTYKTMQLDPSAQPYIEPDLKRLHDYFTQVMQTWSGVFAVSFRLPVPTEVYRQRNQLRYIKDALDRLQSDLSPMHAKIAAPHNGLFLYAAYALKRDVNKAFYYQVMLFMHPGLYEQKFVRHSQHRSDFLMGWFCESLSRTYGMGEHQVRSLLAIDAQFYLPQGWRSEEQSTYDPKAQLLTHLAYLASAKDQFSFTSSLDLRECDEQTQKYHFTANYENPLLNDLEHDNQATLSSAQTQKDRLL